MSPKQAAPLLLFAVLALGACQESGTGGAQTAPSVEPPAGPVPDHGDDALVEVTLEDFAFVAPPQMRSGWTTFRLTNAGDQPHFLMFWRLPDGVTFGDYAEQVGTPFQEEYDRYSSGELTQAEMLEQLGGVLPEWFATVEPMGGVGLTAPGRTSQATLELEPGEYVMECYVLSEEKQFHGTLGMLRPLIVTDDATGMEPPEADIRITLSNWEIDIEGELTAGEHTVAVRASEGAGGIVQHDLHLARLNADLPLEDLVGWMSWIDALDAPAPAEFLGGVDHLAADRTGYFSVTLEPGRYAWISELAAQGMVREFVIE